MQMAMPKESKGVDLLASIKRIRAVRVLARPYLEWKRKREHERYLRSPDHFYLRTLKGIHEGERCFIIGNGPSLTASDLDRLKGEYTFAANRIFKIFDQTNWRPTYYLSVDDKVLKEIEGELFDYELGHMFLGYRSSTIRGDSNKLTIIYDQALTFDVEGNNYNRTWTYISEDVSDHISDGQTVTFCAIQLAIYMGFKEIYLLGVDNNYSKTLSTDGKIVTDDSVVDYFDKKKYDVNPAPIATNLYAYGIAKEYCDNHSIKIRNATRGGKLEVFERVGFDSLFG